MVSSNAVTTSISARRASRDLADSRHLAPKREPTALSRRALGKDALAETCASALQEAGVDIRLQALRNRV